jgi:hypothetical protein
MRPQLLRAKGCAFAIQPLGLASNEHLYSFNNSAVIPRLGPAITWVARSHTPRHVREDRVLSGGLLEVQDRKSMWAMSMDTSRGPGTRWLSAARG